jgi:PIN domain nuclease of toxin-antitoxin system
VIILDTHIWLWWINRNETINKKQLEQIENASEVGVSAISLFEVSWLERHNRIKLPCPKKEWFEKALTGSNIELMPITSEIACLATDLTEHHSDPQDRIIIATSIIHDTLLISSDGKFKFYEELEGRLIK